MVYGQETRPIPTIGTYLFPLFVIFGEFYSLFFEKVVALTGKDVNKNNPINKERWLFLQISSFYKPKTI